MTLIQDLVAAFFAWMDARFVAFCDAVFKPVLKPFFGLVDLILNPIYRPWSSVVAIGFFVGTMLWVCFYLRESYVNLERPRVAWYTDLRLWTIVSMLPHVFFYFYFM